MPFADTPNKQAIRTRWNLPMIAGWRTAIGRKLFYFGLPGPEMFDVLAWREQLDERWTAIEEHFRSGPRRDRADDAATALKTKALRNNISSGLQVLRGDIGDIILDGVDAFGVRPQRSEIVSAERARFSYDLVNLDFDGGLGFTNKATGEAPRVDAIKRLMHRQRNQHFLLFVTVNVRTTLGPEMQDYFERLQRRESDDLMNFYAQCGAGEIDYKLKAIVPLLVLSAAEPEGFRVKCYPPLTYTGHAGARMVHFAFELFAEAKVFPGVSPQQGPDLLRLPMLVVDNGEMLLAAKQHPAVVLDAADLPSGFTPCDGLAASFAASKKKKSA